MKTTEADLSFPMVLLGFIAMAVVVVAGLSLVTEFDQAAARHEELLAENGLRGRVADAGSLTVGEVVWDDAVRHLDNQFDPDWAKQNIGIFFWQTFHFSHSFVLDPAGRAELAWVAGQQAAAGTYAEFASGAAPLVAAVRAEETRRSVGGQGVAINTVAPNLACGFIRSTEKRMGEAGGTAGHRAGDRVGDGAGDRAGEKAGAGAVYILCATLVAPDFGTASVRGRTAPVVVNALPVDGDFVGAFAGRFLLRDLALVAGAQDLRAHSAHVGLLDAGGATVAWLRWTPERPGSDLLRRLGLPLLGILVAFLAGLLLLYRRTRRTAGELVTSEARAVHLAYHDALTGLPNRVLFYDRLSHAMGRMRRSSETLAVFCLDLDRFKLVNDTYGHPAGDELIKKAGRIMVALCRPSETVARMSGDEFAIIMPDASVASAAALAGRLTQALREPIELAAGQVFIGCSVGITLVGDAGLQAADILRQADMALYRSKEIVKGGFSFFEPEMDSTIRMRRALESDLREALATGSLYLVYQPQVNERTGLSGVEALLRWDHPVRGQLSPSFFVGIAEECGLIVDLGMFTLRRAFEDSKRWKGIKVAINISPKQLRMKDFADRVIALAMEVGVDPHLFELEITESLLLGDDPDTLHVLNRLREHGFELALDDFGTGYSSLSYLQRYPINRIKIDRSFIANLGVEQEAEEFINAIVRLARALRLSVIAEGVETHSQQTLLAAAGCTDMQGYFHGRPMPAEDIDAMLASLAQGVGD